jgi:hypothetical protein
VTEDQEPMLAIDPGREKCGLAVVKRSGEAITHEVTVTPRVPERAAALINEYGVSCVLVGGGTASSQVRTLLIGLEGIPVLEAPEAGTTLEARGLYYRDHPPRGWQRLLPRGLRVPPEPVDGYAAEAIALRYLGIGPLKPRPRG